MASGFWSTYYSMFILCNYKTTNLYIKLQKFGIAVTTLGASVDRVTLFGPT